MKAKLKWVGIAKQRLCQFLVGNYLRRKPWLGTCLMSKWQVTDVHPLWQMWWLKLCMVLWPKGRVGMRRASEPKYCGWPSNIWHLKGKKTLIWLRSLTLHFEIGQVPGGRTTETCKCTRIQITKTGYGLLGPDLSIIVFLRAWPLPLLSIVHTQNNLNLWLLGWIS
jgi:hypothetical protein